MVAAGRLAPNGVLEARVLAAVADLPGPPVPEDMLVAAGRDAGVSAAVLHAVLGDASTCARADGLDAREKFRRTVTKLRFALREDAKGYGWTRIWYTIALPVAVGPRERGTIEDGVRQTGGAFANSSIAVFARPWTDDMLRVIEQTGLADRVVLGSGDIVHQGSRDPRRLAATLWDVASIGEAYRSFVATERDVGDAAGVLRSLAHFWRCFDHDPVLPPELVPRPWPGRDARAVIVASVRELRGSVALSRILTTRFTLSRAGSMRWQ